jgi:chromosomal replication initiation ATPase DnaA
MIYVPKRDRAIISEIEMAINSVLGVDKDAYMEVKGLPRGTIKMARYIWIFMVYEETTLGVVDIASMMGRNHSSIVRAIANVKKWKKNKIIKEIYDKRKFFQKGIKE